MVRRFTPPPTARTNARWRFLVLRTSHLHPMARRFAPSPYAGAYAPRHRPAIPPETSPFVSGTATTALILPSRFIASRSHMRRCAAQNGSFLSSTDPRLSAPEEALFRNVRKLRSPISIPRAFNTLTQARSAACTIFFRIMFASCSFRSQSISSHETSYSEVSNSHLCRKLA